jgi:hypothetical protein
MYKMSRTTKSIMLNTTNVRIYDEGHEIDFQLSTAITRGRILCVRKFREIKTKRKLHNALIDVACTWSCIDLSRKNSVPLKNRNWPSAKSLLPSGGSERW